MKNIIGEVRNDYFHMLCSECGEHVKCEYKGWDPGIPYFEYACPNCGNSGTLKLMAGHWKGLAQSPSS